LHGAGMERRCAEDLSGDFNEVLMMGEEKHLR
jgi:hypothetical protein